MNDDLNGLDLEGNESEENLDMNSDFGTDDSTDLEDVNSSRGGAAG
ncbi:hypothetical protein [Deinococcus altitudinis]